MSRYHAIQCNKAIIGIRETLSNIEKDILANPEKEEENETYHQHLVDCWYKLSAREPTGEDNA